MSNEFQKKSSGFVATFIIGLLVIAFMFTGYQSYNTSPNSVATVGDKNVSIDEFNREYQRQTNFYSQMMGGGKPLTQRQIEQYGINRNALNSLVSAKLALILGDKLEVPVSSEQIKETIKSLPYFQTNGNFDLRRYKALLAQNNYTPQSFEDINRNEVVMREVARSLRVPVSMTYLRDIEEIKKDGIAARIIQYNKDSFRRFVPVSKKEISAYLKKPANVKRLEAIHESRTQAKDKKKKISKKHLNELAKVEIQKTKTVEANKLQEATTTKLELALTKGNMNVAKKLIQKYKMNEENSSINALKGNTGDILIAKDDLKTIVKAGKVDDLHVFKGAINVTFIVTSTKKADYKSANLNQEQLGLGQALSRKLNDEMISGLREKYPVKVSSNLNIKF